MGALAAVRSGDQVLARLGIFTDFFTPVHSLALLAASHLAVSAACLLIRAPRFASVRPPRGEGHVDADAPQKPHVDADAPHVDADAPHVDADAPQKPQKPQARRGGRLPLLRRRRIVKPK